MATAGDTSYIAGGLLEVIAADAIMAFRGSKVTANLVKNEYRPVAETISVPVWNNGTAKIDSGDVTGVTDGTIISPANLNSDKKTITLAPFAVRSDLYDDTVNSNADNPQGRLGIFLGEAIASYVDSQLNALFAGLSTTVGTSTSALTIDNLFSAIKNMKSLPSAPKPYSAVLQEAQIWGSLGIMNDLVTTTQFGGSPALQQEGLMTGWVNRIAGIDIYHSPEFTETSSAVMGGILSKDALALGWAGPSNMIKMETDREIAYLRDIYVASIFFGVIEAVDDWGCMVHTRTTV